ncbi:MAG: hypothetical protein VB087_02170 [Candidatus Limiplasma sp.]|nr:hypothetical protein [Candidatus Limiplasma sp.]
MKKVLSLLMALFMVAFVTGALAEVTADAPIEVPVVENGTVVPFQDYNFQITLPSDWNVLEVSEEQAATGIISSFANPEGTRSLTIAYTEFETATDIDSVAAELASTYQNVQTMTINEIPFVSYQIAENDVAGIVTLGASGVGMYQFVFYPASDAEYGSLAMQIAASIDSIQ